MILYSFLGGAGPLHETVYEWNGTQTKTEFSCAACAKILSPEKIIIFETKDGSSRHEKLDAQLSDIPHEFVMIDDGKNKEELWRIFSRIVEVIPENSDIAFDVTNGFRFYPLLGLLSASFTETVKGTRLRYMFYGNYEATRDSDAPKPMIDLTPMLDLLKWTTYADRFIQNGDSTDLAGMVEKLRDSYPHQDVKHTHLDHMADDLKDISEAYLMLRPEDVRRTAVKLKEDTELVEADIMGNAEEQPLGMLMEKIHDQYLEYSDDISEDHDLQILRYQRDMIFRYQSLGQYMQAVSLAKEWIQTWVMAWLGVAESDMFNSEYRKYFNRQIGDFCDNKHISLFTRDQVSQFISFNKLRTIYKDLSKYRNDLDHAGQDERANSARDLKKRIDDVLIKLKDLKLPDDEE